LGEQLHGCGVGVSRISQIPEQMDRGRKKSSHPAERGKETDRKRRKEFLATLATVLLEKLRFLGFSTKAARSRRSPRHRCELCAANA